MQYCTCTCPVQGRDTHRSGRPRLLHTTRSLHVQFIAGGRREPGAEGAQRARSVLAAADGKNPTNSPTGSKMMIADRRGSFLNLLLGHLFLLSS